MGKKSSISGNAVHTFRIIGFSDRDRVARIVVDGREQSLPCAASLSVKLPEDPVGAPTTAQCLRLRGLLGTNVYAEKLPSKINRYTAYVYLAVLSELKSRPRSADTYRLALAYVRAKLGVGGPDSQPSKAKQDNPHLADVQVTGQAGKAQGTKPIKAETQPTQPTDAPVNADWLASEQNARNLAAMAERTRAYIAYCKAQGLRWPVKLTDAQKQAALKVAGQSSKKQSSKPVAAPTQTQTQPTVDTVTISRDELAAMIAAAVQSALAQVAPKPTVNGKHGGKSSLLAAV